MLIFSLGLHQNHVYCHQTLSVKSQTDEFNTFPQYIGNPTKKKCEKKRKGNKRVTGFDERKVEERRPREGRFWRNLKAPEAV